MPKVGLLSRSSAAEEVGLLALGIHRSFGRGIVTQQQVIRRKEPEQGVAHADRGAS